MFHILRIQIVDSWRAAMKSDQFRYGIMPIRIAWRPFAVQKILSLIALKRLMEISTRAEFVVLCKGNSLHDVAARWKNQRVLSSG